MEENSQEGYKTLGWIIEKSEQGLFLVVADEMMQKEIVDIYRKGTVKIYDYKRHPGGYSFYDLQKWMIALPETQTFMISNFHLAVQSEEDLKRLNFSRDMLGSLEKNLIFLITSSGDNRLVNGAYDFYSFFKLQIIFQNDRVEWKKEKEELLFTEEELVQKIGWELKQKQLKPELKEAYILIEQAKDKMDELQYYESEKLLLKAKKIKEELLGTEHLEIAEVYKELAEVYGKQGKYKEAKELCEKSLRIYERVLGEEHSYTVQVYNSLAVMYEHQGEYGKAKELYEKSIDICRKILGEEHPYTAKNYNDLAILYKRQGKYGKAEELYEKSIHIYKKILGEEHFYTASNYNDLAIIYEYQGDYEKAKRLLEKSLHICKKILGEEHPYTAGIYNNLAKVYRNLIK